MLETKCRVNVPLAESVKMKYIFAMSFLIPALFQACSALSVTEEFSRFNSITRTPYVNQTLSAIYSADAELSTLQMIRKAGYPAEGHVIETEDGYLLTLHRIPQKIGSRSVLLQHGLLGSSADWVIPGSGKSLAYILADYGYDVWLGNFRGNTYSRGHVSLSTSDSEFWNFSWHEMGVYDVSAMISYIVNLKKDYLDAYIGHSMGTTTFYTFAIERPHMAKMVGMMHSLAPVAFLSHLKSPVRFLAPFANDYKAIADFLGEDEFLPQNSLIKLLAKYGCEIETWEEKVCANVLFAICGFDKAQFNYTLLPLILNHTPAGTSTKTLVHYGQEIKSGSFRHYDYGVEKNIEVYNQTTPPDYDLTKIMVPITLFYSDNDWLASPIDVMTLSKKLQHKIDVYKVPFPKFNHLDFLWGVDAPKLVYKRLLHTMKSFKRTLKT